MEDINHDLSTLVSCLNTLKSRGYTEDFKVVGPGLKSLKTEEMFLPQDVTICNFYRFEGDSDPGDTSILYAIETKSGLKGTLIDAYGAEADVSVSEFVKQVDGIHKDHSCTDRPSAAAS
jgi:hypothetical protein